MYEIFRTAYEATEKSATSKERSINCYKNYVLFSEISGIRTGRTYLVRMSGFFCLRKKKKRLKATTLNLYNSAIRFFYRNVLHILWDDITVPRMILNTASYRIN